MSTPARRPARIALYDANVLYAAPLRDFFVRLAMTDLVQAHWTDRIHREWIRNLLKNRPDLRSTQLQRTRRLMDEAVPGALVTGDEHRIQDLALPDPDDRHVLAAAVESGADLIVTFNERDFPAEVIEPLGVEAVHPDVFALELLEEFPEEVVRAAWRHRTALDSPPKSPDEYLETFRWCRLPGTADRLAAHREDV